MMTSDDKVGGWVKKGQNHDDVILECPPTQNTPCRQSLVPFYFRPFLSDQVLLNGMY